MPAGQSLDILRGIAGGEIDLLPSDESGLPIFREYAVHRGGNHVLPLGIRSEVDGCLPEERGKGVLGIVYPYAVALQGRLDADVGEIVNVQFGKLELPFHLSVQVAFRRYS